MKPADTVRLAVVPPLAFATGDFSALRSCRFAVYQARCRLATSLAVRRGELTRAETCERCGRAPRASRADERDGIKAHHPDYSNPMLVVWLCGSCHNVWHAEFIAAWREIPFERRLRIANVVGARVAAMNRVSCRGKKHYGFAAAVPL